MRFLLQHLALLSEMGNRLVDHGGLELWLFRCLKSVILSAHVCAPSWAFSHACAPTMHFVLILTQGRKIQRSRTQLSFSPLLPMHGGFCCFVCLFFPPRSNRAPVANSDVGAVDSPVGLWCTGESRGCGAGALWADASCAASASSAVLTGRHGSKLGSESQTVGLGLRKQDRRR